ncbi:MAG: hypothetical protein Q4B50_07800, partial [Bacillota bacterium]|nr:hypothetical protein [Bacillota bacterium]
MLFSKAFEMYEKELTAAVKQIRKQDKNDELVLLFEWLDLLHSSYPILTEREKSYREKTDAAMKAYLERENRASVDGKYKPIIRFFQEAMQKDDLILPRMVELRQENRYKTSKIVSGTKYIKRLARAERNTGKSYEDLYRERLQSFLERMDRTAQEAFWNTAEFKAMHNALKACAPSDPGKGQAEIRGGLKNLTQRVRAYLGKKSLDPFTQRGKDRLELARQLLNASQELLFEYEASAAMKKIEKDIVDGKPGHLALIDEKIDLCKEQLRKHLEEKSGERDLHSILDTDEFIRLFSRLEYLRVQRKNIEQGLLLPREIIILGTHQEDRGMDQEISPVLLQIETKEQLLALINSKEPVLRQKENGDWVSPAQQELEAFFQNIEPVSMRQEPGQGGQQAEEILIPLLEIRPEEELLPQQNVIDQDAQEERELLELLSAPRLKEEE